MSGGVKEVLIKVITILLAITFLLPSNIFADKEQEEIDRETKDIKRIVKYITINKHNKVVFNRKKAVNDGVSATALEIGDSFMKYYGDISFIKDGNLIRKKKKKKWEVYGRYCGPGHSGPGKPIDRLDAACARHDKCYHDRGYHRCSCDEKLKRELSRMKLRGKARRIAWVMRAWLFIKTRRISKSGGWFSCRR